eukprot:CAMPEP_0172370758 /NCGR_PEP_ID=MMETSP1060-20121228/39496_1 /TAXON_ID=37318 /ORGANISM="Pseudo-nitzschia pungens, Strain cf. cingulata" /LENGTH=950 /DNA_ID=CAMNT_0013096137 /DNA_START=404 /DNA_END=3256 /DNA_ORIENTATION=-
MKSVYRQTTARLLAVPAGKFDDKLWSETHMTILWWLNSCLDENLPATKASSEVGAESIHWALQLLDRMYEEEQETLLHRNENLPEFFNEELLNLILNRWRLLISSRRMLLDRKERDYSEGDQTKHDAEPSPIKPRNLLDVLYRYQETSPNMQPNIQSYAMIIDTISSVVESYAEDYKMAEKENLMEMVDEIVEWLVDQASDDHSSIDNIENTGDDQTTNDIEEDHSPSVSSTPAPLQHQKPRFAPTPNVVLFSSAMDAWTKSGLNGSPERVEELLANMLTLQEWYPEWDIAPNKFTYSTAIDAWAKVRRVDKVKELLQNMHQQAMEQDDPTLKPGLPAFNGYLVALARSGRVDEAETLLSQMEDLYDSGELEEPPSVISYTTVIDGFARSKVEGSSVRAESFLLRMIDREDLSPNAVTYNSVINAHVQCFNIEAAENLLREMHETYLRSGNMEIRPTMQSYSVVISGIAKSRRKNAGERAERILEQIKEMAQSGDLDEPPDVILYNAVLDCWAKSSSTQETASRALAFLKKMKQDGIVPDAISYNTIIHCLAQSGMTLDAELMLEEMKDTGVQPNSITYNTLLAACFSQKPHRTRRGKDRDDSNRAEKLFDKMRSDPNIQPDVVTYNTMLHSYSRQGDFEKAESLLKEMFLEDSPVSPDSTSMNTIINAWTKSGKDDAPQRAEAILEQMLKPSDSNEAWGKSLEGIRPSSITFNSVMTAWTKTRRAEAADRCQHLFDLMENNAVGEVQPDYVTFNIMIYAWSLSTLEDAPDRAEALLSEMHKRFQAGNARMRPSTKTYGSLINVWAKSRRPEAGEKAEKYLRKIIQISEGKYNLHRQKLKSFNAEQPRVFEFTSAIRAWFKSDDPRAIYKADGILYLLLQQVTQGNKEAAPNSKLFGAFLQVLASSEIPKKHVYADRVVELLIEFKVKPNKMLLDLLNQCYGGRPTKLSS